jgi:hypothetical protein
VKDATDGTLVFLDRHIRHISDRTYAKRTSSVDMTNSGIHPSSAYPNTVQQKNYYDGSTATNTSVSSASSHITPQQTAYPAATQYPVYSEPSPAQSLAFTPPGASPSYTTYPGNDDKARLVGLAAQASNMQAHSNAWQGPSPVGNLGMDAWGTFTKTVASISNHPDHHESYGVNPYIQTHAQQLTDGGSANGVHATANMAVMGPLNHGNVGMDQVTGNLEGQETGSWPMQWPNVVWDNPNNNVMGL